MDIKQRFDADGYVTGLSIMSAAAMRPYREAFDRLEAAAGKRDSQVGLMNLHKKDRRVWELVSHRRVLELMSELLGPDLLLLGTHFFCKQPDFADSYVAWHQDVTYWGLEPPRAVTLWLAIDDADVANGCMRVIPGSHRRGQLPHGTAATAGNLLSVNQEVAPDLIDTAAAVDLPLAAGMASIHDGLLVHGSNPNRSDRRRCGLTMRFTDPAVRPVKEVPKLGAWRPILVQGADRLGHFDLEAVPTFAGT